MPRELPDGVSLPVDGSLPTSAVETLPHRPLSIYVHVPFCRARCGYCDFNTYTPSELPGMSGADYLTALSAEFELARRVLGHTPPVSTVFFGGGTPTMLESGQLTGVLRRIENVFGLAEGAEITTEANPETVTPEYFAALKHAGFTRISLGMQSAVPHVLATLDRLHTPRRAVEAAGWAHQAGFEHVSLDLIYGTPGESIDDWQRSLEAVAATPVDHVSAYSLIVEPGTRLATRVRRGELPMPDDDELADKYVMADEILAGYGFSNYEVSNWAKHPSSRCQHNLHYWRGGNWWGFGPGSHSHIGGVRFWNRKHPRSWAEKLLAEESPAQAGEFLTAEEQRVERVLLELRLADGLDLTVLSDTERARVPNVLDRELGSVADGTLRLTRRGRLLADGVVRDLLDF